MDFVFNTCYGVNYIFETSGAKAFTLFDEKLFSNDSFINKNEIVAIHCVTATELSSVPNINDLRDLPSYNALSGGFITLRDNQQNVIATLPLTGLTQRANNGKLMVLANLKIDWSSCSFTFNSNPAGLNSSNGLYFNLIFAK